MLDQIIILGWRGGRSTSRGCLGRGPAAGKEFDLMQATTLLENLASDAAAQPLRTVKRCELRLIYF